MEKTKMHNNNLDSKNKGGNDMQEKRLKDFELLQYVENFTHDYLAQFRNVPLGELPEKLGIQSDVLTAGILEAVTVCLENNITEMLFADENFLNSPIYGFYVDATDVMVFILLLGTPTSPDEDDIMECLCYSLFVTDEKTSFGICFIEHSEIDFSTFDGCTMSDIRQYMPF